MFPVMTVPDSKFKRNYLSKYKSVFNDFSIKSFLMILALT